MNCCKISFNKNVGADKKILFFSASILMLLLSPIIVPILFIYYHIKKL